MNVQLMLCDYARAIGGKLDVLGAGWDEAGPMMPQQGLGLIFTVPWAEVGVDHKAQIHLLDEKGKLVVGDGGEPVFALDFDFRVDKPAGVLLGAPVRHCMALNLGPGMPLTPGRRYRYVVFVDGHSLPDWEAPFSVRAQPMRQAS